MTGPTVRSEGGCGLSPESTSEASGALHPTGVGAAHDDGRPEQPLAQVSDPHDAIGVQHHLDDAWVVEQDGERPELAPKRAGPPSLALG